MANELIPDDADHPNVLHALVRKRSEISGKIEFCQLELRRLIGELDHVDATIRVFNPNVDVGNIRPKKPLEAVSFRGEVTRVVFNTLRQATEPMTCRDIAKHLMVARGLPLDDQRFFPHDDQASRRLPEREAAHQSRACRDGVWWTPGVGVGAVKAPRKWTVSFSRGQHFYQIAHAYDGSGRFVGLKDGRVVAVSVDRNEVTLNSHRSKLLNLGVKTGLLAFPKTPLGCKSLSSLKAPARLLSHL